MKKKLIGLGTLLLVLLLGLFTTSYADSNNTWTLNQLKNVYENYLTYCGWTSNNIASFLSYHENEFVTLVNNMNNNKCVVVQFQRGNFAQNSCIFWTNSNTTLYDYNGNLYCFPNVGFSGFIIPNNNSAGWSYNNISNFTYNTNMYYFSQNVYTGSNTGVVKYPSGPNPTNLLTGSYLDDYFTFSYNPDLTNLQVPDINVQGELLTLKSMSYNDFVGEYVAIVGMLKYLDYIDCEQYYYDNSISGWKLYRNNDNYIKNNDFESTEPIEVKCPSGWWVGNTLIKFTAWNTFGNNFGPQIFYVYLLDNSSIISNGVLQIGTFSGDYNNNMQNDLNNQKADERTQEIINTITDDSKVDSMLDDFASGDLAGKLGYVEHTLPGVTDDRNPVLLVYNIINDLCNVLLDDSNVYWDYSMHGEPSTRIYASDFTTEETPAKVFVRLSLIFGTLFMVYVQFKHIIELIDEGRAPQVLHEVDADVYFYKM